MNVTPEVLERLKQLANLVSKKGNSQKNVNDNKKEPDQKGNEDDKENDTSGSGKTSVTNGRVSPDLNGTNEDAPTPDNKQVKGDGVFSQMDTDVFRQVLKDVITKRTLAIEKRVLADVEALKTQVCELEAQKIQLQCDSERLKQTLKEITTKQEKQKVQMVSCGTQVDMELIEERPLSPEISKPVRPKFVPERSILLNQMRSAKNILENQGETVDNEKVVAESSDKQKVFLQTSKKNAKHSGTTESMTVCSNSGMSTAQNVPATAQNVTNVLPDKDVSVGVLIQPPSQGRKITTESVVTRDPHDKLLLRNIHSSDNTQTPLNFRPLSVVRVEAHHVGQEQQNDHRQSPRLDMPQQKRGPPGLNTSVPSGYPCIQNYQGHFSQRSSESFLPNRQQFSSCRWLGSSPNQVNQNGHVHRQPHPSVYNRPTDLTNHRSNATSPGGPHNVTFFDQPKRRRVENMSSSNVQRTNIVSSNENYVMEHFKVQRTPVSPGAARSQKYMQTYGPVTTNQAPYISRPLNHPPGTHFNQGVPNSRPPPNASLHAMNKAPNRPPAGFSQGQLVEKVLYPTAGSQPVGNAYQDYQRVMLPGPHPRTENVQASNKSSQSNNTVYVVQEYQVLSQYNMSRSRTTPLQSIAPAPAPVPRNPTCPPVQSPGISSTASPSACHLGGPNAGQVSPAVSHPSNANAVRTSITQTLLKTPPKPTASIVVVQDGIVLSWNMKLDDSTAKIDNYELFACQDGAESTNPPIMWKKIGIVKALPLPMACTLTQFSSGNKYHFAVRAVDDQERAGPFSDPCTIALTN